MRKRLTAATLQDQTRMASSLMAADLGIRLLGAGATDSEVTRVASALLKELSPASLQDIYKVTARVAAESGEDFPAIDSQESPQPESTNTQQYVAEHEITPDHAVADVAMNEKSPTQDPKASKKATKGAKKVKADMVGDNGGGLITGEDVEGDSVKPDFLGEDVESPPMPPESDVSDELDDSDESDQDIDFEMSDSSDEDMQEKQKPEIRDPDETEEDSDEDHLDSDESLDDETSDLFDDLEDEGDLEDSDDDDDISSLLDDPEDYSEEADDFALDDLDALGDLDSGDDFGIDDIDDLNNRGPSGAEASKKSAARTAKKNETFSGWDDVLKPKKKSRTASSYKPSRVRRASAQSARSDVDALFDVADYDSAMREFRY